MPMPLTRNPYFMAKIHDAEEAIRERNGGSFPKVSRTDQRSTQATLILLKNANYSLRAGGLFGREKRLETVERLNGTLATMAGKYGMTPDELKLFAELDLNQRD